MEGYGLQIFPKLNNYNDTKGMNAGISYPGVQNESVFLSVKNKICRLEDAIKKNTADIVISEIPIVRRIAQIDKNADNKDMAKAVGLGALGTVYLKEDLRDLMSILGKSTSNVLPEYGPLFRFFQGTSLENLLKGSKFEEFGKKYIGIEDLGNKILRSDRSLAETGIADKLFKYLGIKPKVDTFSRTIQWAKGEEVLTRSYVKFAVKGAPAGSLKAFAGELLGNTLSKTTTYGLLISTLFEIPNLIEAAKERDTKKAAKSGLNITIPTVSAAFISSLLSKLPGKYGKLGSILGLGLGYCLGGKAVDKIIPEENKQPFNFEMNNLPKIA